MSEDDHALLPARRHCVAYVFARVPLAWFSADQHIHFVAGHDALDHIDWRRSRVEGYGAHGRLWVADNTNRLHLQLLLDRGGEIGEALLRQMVQAHVVGHLILLPAERGTHSANDAVRLRGVPMIVKAPDHHLIVFDE